MNIPNQPFIPEQKVEYFPVYDTIYDSNFGFIIENIIYEDEDFDLDDDIVDFEEEVIPEIYFPSASDLIEH